MSVKFKDYYKLLDVPRTATQAQIKKAYRKLARKHHPDVNKSAGAEDRFKEISEAYKALGDPEKRKRYDQLGMNWHTGQDFTPPPEWGDVKFEFQGAPGEGFTAEEFGGFRNFFETLFGRAGASGGVRHASASPRATQWKMRGQDHEAEMTVGLDDAFHGAKKSISIQSADIDDKGRVHRKTKTFNVTIPAGITDGSRIRLAKQGGAGIGGGPAGHLYLRVHIAPHRVFRVKNHDLEMTLPVAPWEAALGAKVTIATLDGKVSLRIPHGTQSGSQLRLRGKGLPARGHGGKPGDLLVDIKIVVPKRLSEQEKKLFQELAETSKFKPRTNANQ